MYNNNSNDMKTVVETFFVEENLNLITESDDLQKWGDLVAHLGLNGQSKLQTEDKSPVPFLWMNKVLVNVFETLCPSKMLVEEFNKTPIPLEILELISLSKSEGYFYKIQVWYDDKTPDPVVVGLVDVEGRENGDWYKDYGAQKYLIGKWSDVKSSFKELFERAKNRFISENSTRLKIDIKRANRELEDIELTANDRFGNSDFTF